MTAMISMPDRARSTEQDPRWRAVLDRDQTADGRFVFAVRTTGIYCRPSCSSRRPNPENVLFFTDGPAAVRSGFRACLKCRPDDIHSASPHIGIVTRACRRLEREIETVSLPALAREAGMSPFHFHRVFKAATGLTPRAYRDGLRSGRLRTSLDDAAASITAAIYDAGFGSAGRFYERADSTLGMTPTAFRRGGAGADIRFAVGQCALGAILVAMSQKGICAITLGDGPDELVRDLQDRFPQANLIGGDQGFEALVAKVVGFIERPGAALDLPLDIQGTAFQQRVWQALRGIPTGATRSYADIAAEIGQPRAVRAVAQACGANAIAVVIPCHRVVRRDGHLSGYRWGIERKRSLLASERR